jgi:hypothetical protein
MCHTKRPACGSRGKYSCLSSPDPDLDANQPQHFIGVRRHAELSQSFAQLVRLVPLVLFGRFSHITTPRPRLWARVHTEWSSLSKDGLCSDEWMVAGFPITGKKLLQWMEQKRRGHYAKYQASLDVTATILMENLSIPGAIIKIPADNKGRSAGWYMLVCYAYRRRIMQRGEAPFNPILDAVYRLYTKGTTCLANVRLASIPDPFKGTYIVRHRDIIRVEDRYQAFVEDYANDGLTLDMVRHARNLPEEAQSCGVYQSFISSFVPQIADHVYQQNVRSMSFHCVLTVFMSSKYIHIYRNSVLRERSCHCGGATESQRITLRRSQASLSLCLDDDLLVMYSFSLLEFVLKHDRWD